jgi:hypothetical protein
MVSFKLSDQVREKAQKNVGNSHFERSIGRPFLPIPRGKVLHIHYVTTNELDQVVFTRAREAGNSLQSRKLAHPNTSSLVA